MKYTIFTLLQVTPKYNASNALNFGPAPVYPVGASVYYKPETLDIWSADPDKRKVLLSNPNAELSDSMTDIDEAFPLFRDWKAKFIRIEGERRLNTLAGHYLPAERETWPYQREEAMRWRDGGMQATPFCDAIAAGRGVPREAFMTAVLQNTELFSQYSSMFLGTQQAILDRIYAAQTVEAIVAEAWPA